MTVLEKAPKARKGSRPEQDKPQAGEPKSKARASAKAQAAPKRKVLLTASGKGGSTKTTLAVHLLVSAATAGLRVALLDLDSQKTAHKWAADRPEELVPISSRAVDLSQAVEALDEMLAGDVDLVVIDTPPTLDADPSQTRTLIQRADFVVVPTSASPTDLRSVEEFMGLVCDLGAQGAFVLSGIRRNSKMALDARMRLNDAGGRLCPVDVRRLDDIATVIDLGATVHEMKGASGAEDMAAVWTYVRKELGL